MSKQTPAPPSLSPAPRVNTYGTIDDESTVLRIAREGLRTQPPVVRFIERERAPPGRMLLQL